MIQSIKSRVNVFLTKKKWRKKNPHNTTTAENCFDTNYVTVGKYSYGPIKVLNWGEKKHLIIGHFCSIAQDVTFLLSSDHYTSNISTFPFKALCLGMKNESISNGDIIIEDDVWIGYRSTILSGVHIGQGAIVAAGAVVVKDVPPYAIVGGIPAKVIKYRFDEKTIEKLLQVDYSSLKKEDVQKHIDDLYSVLEKDEQIEWLPKREIIG